MNQDTCGYTYQELLEINEEVIENIIHDRSDYRFVGAMIDSYGSFEAFILQLIEDGDYFKEKIQEEVNRQRIAERLGT